MCILIPFHRDDSFQLFNWIQLLFSEKCFPKTAGHSQNRSIMTFLKWDVDGSSCFSLISVILFSKQDHPWMFIITAVSIPSLFQDGNQISEITARGKRGGSFSFIFYFFVNCFFFFFLAFKICSNFPFITLYFK